MYEVKYDKRVCVVLGSEPFLFNLCRITIDHVLENQLLYMIQSTLLYACSHIPQDVVEKVDQTENMMDIMEKGKTNMLLETKHERFSRVLM
jgi:hypothetical protein